jgi:hypothetical protein
MTFEKTLDESAAGDYFVSKSDFVMQSKRRFEEEHMDNERGDSGDRGERRLDDIQTIKEVLLRAEKKYLIEPWSYFGLGALSVAGGLVHFIIWLAFASPGFDYFLFVWVPVLAVGLFFETVGFVRRMAKEALPVLSRPGLWLFVALTLLSVVFAVLAIIFVRFHAEAYLPTLVDFCMGFGLIAYALLSCPPLFVQSALIILTGFILFVFQVPEPYSVLSSALVIGASLFWAGGAALRNDKK